MNLKIKKTVFILVVIINIIACNSGPKIVDPYSNNGNSEENNNATYTPLKKETKSISKTILHTVKINKVLKTTRYLYMNVTENDAQFWIATRIMDVTVGETYYYKGGLLKTNYESKDFDKVFDKIYLISGSLVAANHSTNPNGLSNNFKPKKQYTEANKPVNSLGKKIEIAGSMKISDLIKNAKKLAGKKVQISGICVKSNPNIMKTNWLHIKDGSKDDYDLVVTSNTFIPEGDAIITIEATVTLNKDFGAGYTYALILENGTIVP